MELPRSHLLGMERSLTGQGSCFIVKVSCGPRSEKSYTHAIYRALT